jgi:hypothetical protein
VAYAENWPIDIDRGNKIKTAASTFGAAIDERR